MNKSQSTNKQGILFAGIGFELVGLIMAAVFLGQWVDKKWNLNGLGIAGLCFIALIGWLVHLFVLLKQFTRHADDDKPKPQ